MKKKLKYTKNKLQIDKLKIYKIISHLIKEETPVVKNENTQDEWAVSSNTWDTIVSSFAQYREENWFNPDATWINVTKW